MGQLRFIVSPPERITEEVLQFAYVSGMDRTPWVVDAQAEEGELVLERDVGTPAASPFPGTWKATVFWPSRPARWSNAGSHIIFPWNLPAARSASFAASFTNGNRWVWSFRRRCISR